MAQPRPWEVGDKDERWRGYLDPSTGLPGREDTWILRNSVGARTWDQLREREDEAVEIRALTMPSYGIPATYDLDGLRAIHHNGNNLLIVESLGTSSAPRVSEHVLDQSRHLVPCVEGR